MRQILKTLTLAAATVLLLGSCAKINERIDGLDKRVNDLENEKIASIENQIASINTSIADLVTIRSNIQDLISKTQAQGGDITGLKAADVSLGQRIDELKSYIDGDLTSYAKIDWVKATFATLEQHQWTCDTIAGIDARIGALDTRLSQSISGLESSLKQWVNVQLDAYYTAA